jgi:hypothetical protein
MSMCSSNANLDRDCGWDGRNAVNAGLRPPPSAAYGIDSAAPPSGIALIGLVVVGADEPGRNLPVTKAFAA